MDLLVTELPLVGHQGAAIVMTGQQRALVCVECLVQRLVGQMCDVQDHADTLHLPEEIPPLREQSPLGAGAVRVGAETVMGWPDDSQAGFPPGADIRGGEDRIGPFHAENIAQRLSRGVGLPGGQVRIESGGVFDWA